MKFIIVILITVFSVSAETLFEVKDAMNNPVLSVSTDGLRILNQGDTVMVISANEIKANLQNSKGLSRSFSVTTASSKGDENDLMRLTADSTRFWISDTGSGFGVSSQTALKEKSVATNFLKVSNVNTQMREGGSGNRYTDFSPDNIFIGLNSGINSRPGQIEPYYGKYNTFLGNESGYSNTYGFGNIFIGYQAGYFSTTSNQNISIGYQAGYNMTGQSNTLVGHLVGKGTGSGGDYNSFYGRAAGFSIGSAASNTLIGALSGSSLTNGYSNTLIGKEAGKGQSGAAFSYNTVLGSAAATQLTTGGNNVVVGYNSGGNITTGSGNIFLGYQSGASETGSNKLYIENSNSATPLIYGDFATDALTVNGTLTSTGNIYMNGTSLQILTNPGTGTSPTNYVYQGSGLASTSKQYAFAVNDALWVTSNAYIDGNLQIQGGTSIGMTQAGTYTAGANSSGGVKTFTINFPTTFGTTPKVNVTPRGENFPDVFAVTTRNISASSFQVNVYRVDNAGAIWGQNLKLDWYAWE